MVKNSLVHMVKFKVSSRACYRGPKSERYLLLLMNLWKIVEDKMLLTSAKQTFFTTANHRKNLVRCRFEKQGDWKSGTASQDFWNMIKKLGDWIQSNEKETLLLICNCSLFIPLILIRNVLTKCFTEQLFITTRFNVGSGNFCNNSW